MAKVKTNQSNANQEAMITSLIGLAAIFVATAIWWSLAPQWLTSTWHML